MIVLYADLKSFTAMVFLLLEAGFARERDARRAPESCGPLPRRSDARRLAVDI